MKTVKNNDKNTQKVEYNCVLHVKRENGYINFSIDLDDIKDVKVRLVVPNVKLATKIMHKVNKE